MSNYVKITGCIKNYERKLKLQQAREYHNMMVDSDARKAKLYEIEAKRNNIRTLIQRKLKEYFDEYQKKGYSGDELRNKICAEVYKDVNDDYEQYFRGDSKATIVHFAKKLNFQNELESKSNSNQHNTDFEDR